MKRAIVIGLFSAALLILFVQVFGNRGPEYKTRTRINDYDINRAVEDTAGAVVDRKIADLENRLLVYVGLAFVVLLVIIYSRTAPAPSAPPAPQATPAPAPANRQRFRRAH